MKLDEMNIVITGANGVLASHLLNIFLTVRLLLWAQLDSW